MSLKDTKWGEELMDMFTKPYGSPGRLFTPIFVLLQVFFSYMILADGTRLRMRTPTTWVLAL